MAMSSANRTIEASRAQVIALEGSALYEVLNALIKINLFDSLSVVPSIEF